MFKREKPFYYFIIVTAVGLFPWSILLIKNTKSMNLKENSLFLFWVITTTLFFSISKSKLPHYVLPCFPAWAIIVSKTLKKLPPNRIFKTVWSLYLIGALLIFPYFSRKRTSLYLVRNITPPIYSYEDALFGASFYSGSIVRSLENKDLISIIAKKRNFYLVLKKNKIDDVDAILKTCKKYAVRRWRKFLVIKVNCEEEKDARYSNQKN